jgi:hypothetical protein
MYDVQRDFVFSCIQLFNYQLSIINYQLSTPIRRHDAFDEWVAHNIFLIELDDPYAVDVPEAFHGVAQTGFL